MATFDEILRQVGQAAGKGLRRVGQTVSDFNTAVPRKLGEVVQDIGRGAFDLPDVQEVPTGTQTGGIGREGVGSFQRTARMTEGGLGAALGGSQNAPKGVATQVYRQGNTFSDQPTEGATAFTPSRGGLVASENAPGTALGRIREALAENEALRLAKQRQAAEAASGLRILSNNPFTKNRERKRAAAAQARADVLGKEIRDLTITQPAQQEADLRTALAEQETELAKAAIQGESTVGAAQARALGDVEAARTRLAPQTIDSLGKLFASGIDPQAPEFKLALRRLLQANEANLGLQPLSTLDLELADIDFE